MSSFDHITGTFIGKGGVEIFFQKWVAPKAKSALIISHGLGEHSGRYGNLINTLEGRNISVYALDHRGHGNSGGERGHVESFMDFIYDLKLFTDFVREENGGNKVGLLGHSMGGVIATKYALTYPEDLAGLILSSAAVMLATEVPGWKTSLANFLSKYIPSFSMNNGLNAEDLSHDEDVVKDYENDPFVHDRVTARWYTEIMQANQECLVRSYELKMPLLVIHGNGDKIVDYKGSERIYENASSPGKEIQIFQGLYHETMNEREEERAKVLAVIEKWIDKNLLSGKKSAAKKKPSAGKKSSTKKAASKKSASKKTSANKSGSKSETKQRSPKSSSKKSTSKKTPAKSTAKKTASKKTSSSKKGSSGKSTSKKKS